MSSQMVLSVWLLAALRDMNPSMLSGFRGVALVRASERRESQEGSGSSGNSRMIFLDLVLGYLMPLGFLNDLGGTGRKDDKKMVEHKEAAKKRKD